MDPTDVMASYRTRMPTQNPQIEVPSALVSVGEPFWWGSMDGGPLLRQLNADPFVNEGEWEGCDRKRPMTTEQRLEHRYGGQLAAPATAQKESKRSSR